MNINEKLQQEDGTGQANARSFRSLVGGLIYLSHTHPDLFILLWCCFTVYEQSIEASFGAAKRILHYIAGTLEHGIWYSYVSNFRLVGYTDSDWGGSVDDIKSTSGNTFSLGSGVIT